MINKCVFGLIGCLFLANSIRLMFFISDQENATIRDGLLISPVVADLGSVKQGTLNKTRFMLKNTSTKPIDQIQLQASCGCLTLDTFKSVLAPGESTTALVEFNSIKKRGWSNVFLILKYVANGKTTEQLLEVRADVRPFVVLKPEEARFSISKSDDKAISKCTIRFTAVENSDLELRKLICSHPAIFVQEIDEPAVNTGDLSGCIKTIEISLDRKKWFSSPSKGSKKLHLSVATSIDSEPNLIVPIIVN
ncbi:DUF1573 domain-containing protein [uncultured Gimesia sp.]|jgi:hypothetical protein|uniref:DUF1573 domain-containing protein n=1 Tax=uncultured Gimesia sp. TaxID=1678688 RepID=UPI00261D2CEE|nr:DUF1573 domain-containing protein [uncultured Gimesia sp.]